MISVQPCFIHRNALIWAIQPLLIVLREVTVRQCPVATSKTLDVCLVNYMCADGRTSISYRWCRILLLFSLLWDFWLHYSTLLLPKSQSLQRYRIAVRLWSAESTDKQLGSNLCWQVSYLEVPTHRVRGRCRVQPGLSILRSECKNPWSRLWARPS